MKKVTQSETNHSLPLQELIQKYLHLFEKVRRDKTHGGPAPHKPILLLSVLQAVRNGSIKDNRIFITPELVALFKSNWSTLVTSQHHCNISYPFYYLKGDKFWELVPRAGFDNINSLGSIVKSFANLNAAVDHAKIPEELYQIMADPESNSYLTHCLLRSFFPANPDQFINYVGNSDAILNEIEDKILSEPSELYQQEIKKLLEQKNEEELFLRGSVFKREIPKIYNNTCCISGMRVDAIGNISMIDACHIKPFCESYDDTITNGIALCPNLHRAFDRGLIAIDDEYKVIVSPSFVEAQTSYSIRTFEGTTIRLPIRNDYYPFKENFAWHRENIFG